MDIGLGPKMVLDYGPEDHQGLKAVYDTIVRYGKPVVFDNWKSLGK
jgi:hypothetical protein